MKLLLHVCCGPDVTVALERMPQTEKLCLFFDNPNIHPEKEYQRRLDAFRTVAESFNVSCMAGEYNPENWLAVVAGYENDPEGGDRCRICFQHRLERTAQKAVEADFDTIGSVFTTSPHKDADLINSVGAEIAGRYGLTYMSSNFKKKDGFKRSVEISKELGLYRQNFCGCRFSVPQNGP